MPVQLIGAGHGNLFDGNQADSADIGTGEEPARALGNGRYTNLSYLVE
jgi:hypothetical protein